MNYISKLFWIFASKAPWKTKIILISQGISKFITRKLGGYDSIESERCRFMSQLSDLRYLHYYKLTFDFSGGEKRIWFFFNAVDSQFVFGGYIAVLQFIIFLKYKGHDIGIITRQKPKNVDKHSLLKEALSGVEVLVVESGSSIRINDEDTIITYDWVTSYILLRANRYGNKKIRHYYFCQEDESVFYPNGSVSSLVDIVQKAFITSDIIPIFNSKKLKDYFAKKMSCSRLVDSLYFEQAIPDCLSLQQTYEANNDRNRIVVYGRPEKHAERNMFEIVILALAKAIECDYELMRDFDYLSLGSKMFDRLPLSNGVELIMKEKVSYDEYINILKNSAVVVALMNAPHPSVPPFESVRNGIRTVINCGLYERDEKYYNDISNLFYPAYGGIDEIANAIMVAVKDWKISRSTDSEMVYGHDNIPHPNNWNDSFEMMFTGRVSL
ncbi:MAG: hypothetical protein KZQ75_00430 [Candidatus Thiodiazotropha sp. (ex Myrtea spinifera)]|nr:hypothetical protein [Candidatus Thiodiazotropha sp. (ex Myrtea spinifera)]